jgi:thiamine pyrophosphate-dependent acetolactate synthase large subunit-like protein
MATVADLMIDRLIDWGIDTIFGLPGDGINGLFDALRTRQDRIRFVQVRHEEAAAFAACGYAKFTKRLGVCMATSGPGGIHLLNGLYDATMDGVPVLAITGHTFHDLIGMRQQQDVALDKLMDNVAVYSERIAGPAHVVNAVDEAIRLALTRRAVAHLTIPKDMQTWDADAEPRSNRNIKGHSAMLAPQSCALPREDDLRAAATLLNQGKKVVIFAGQGALGTRTELEQIAETLGAVIIKPLLGKGTVPDDSPYTTGGIGLLGTTPSQNAVEDCDTLLIVGSSFPYESFYPKPDQARCVQIDIDPSRLGLRYPIDIGLVGSSIDVLRALLPLLTRNDERGFLAKAQDDMHDWWELLEERGTSTEMPMKPQVVTYALDKVLANDAIVTVDSGTSPTWLARHWKLRGDQLFTVSGNLATMACALPYAVGAQIAHPNRQVVAFAGDGALTMLIGELATCVKYRLPIKIIVLKNNVLGQIKWEQMIMEGFPEFGVELQPIDFCRVAEGFGVQAMRLDDPGKAHDTLRQALAYNGPVLIEAVVDANEPPMPPSITRSQAVKFAESLLKGQPDRGQIVAAAAKDLYRQIV